MDRPEIDFARLIGPVARRILGEPNQIMSNRAQLRFGRQGSVAVDIAGEKAGTWFDHEAGQGGGVLDLLRHRLGLHNGAAIEWLRQEIDAEIPAVAPRGAISASFHQAPAPKPSAPAQEAPSEDEPPFRQVASYDYVSADGELLFQVCRLENGIRKTFRQRRPREDGSWEYTVKGTEMVPYRLPELLASSGPVYVVEGEKDVDNLRALGFTATCNAGGAGKWHDPCTEALRGRDVIILPDNDPQATTKDGQLRFHPDGRPVFPGQDHAALVAERLRGVAKSARIVNLPDLPPKGDVSDWLAAGRTAADLRAATERDNRDKRDILPMSRLADITPEPDAKDFVQGLLTMGSAAVVYGESNAGKTFWTTDLALHVAAGMEWNGRRVEGGPVVYVALEGGIGFRNRTSVWVKEKGVDPRNVPFYAISCPVNMLDPEADMPRLLGSLQQVTEEAGQPVLVVIDTLSRALSGGDENSSEDMGALVRNMDHIRHEIGCCVLFIHHSGKDSSRGARGHSLLRAAVDTEIEVKAEEGSDLKTATTVKQRELPKGEKFHFSLRVVEVGQNRHGEAVTTCVVEPSEEGPAQGGKKARQMSGDCKAALNVLVQAVLNDGREGHKGVPHGIPSIPAEWWRDRFYADAKSGASQEAKKRAFRRAADTLVERQIVGSANNRVWLAGEAAE